MAKSFFKSSVFDEPEVIPADHLREMLNHLTRNHGKLEALNQLFPYHSVMTESGLSFAREGQGGKFLIKESGEFKMIRDGYSSQTFTNLATLISCIMEKIED